MSEVSPHTQTARARSFGEVAEAYDRARPSYPDAAVDWMVGEGPARVLELGAGTGKLTEVLHAAGHHVVATDPLPAMLQRLARRTPVPHAVAVAEQLPLPSRSVDVVVCGQSFHWFDHDVALPEIARVLRPGGVLALAWNAYDTSIPWVRRLSRLIEPAWAGGEAGPEEPLMQTPHFGFVDSREHRFWQPHTARTLADLARSVSHVATMRETERERTLAKVAALYDDYGRGPDGMKLPYLTRCYRAVVRHDELPPETPPPTPTSEAPGTDDPAATSGPSGTPETPGSPEPDLGVSLIDFR